MKNIKIKLVLMFSAHIAIAEVAIQSPMQVPVHTKIDLQEIAQKTKVANVAAEKVIASRAFTQVHSREQLKQIISSADEVVVLLNDEINSRSFQIFDHLSKKALKGTLYVLVNVKEGSLSDILDDFNINAADVPTFILFRDQGIILSAKNKVAQLSSPTQVNDVITFLNQYLYSEPQDDDDDDSDNSDNSGTTVTKVYYGSSYPYGLGYWGVYPYWGGWGWGGYYGYGRYGYGRGYRGGYYRGGYGYRSRYRGGYHGGYRGGRGGYYRGGGRGGAGRGSSGFRGGRGGGGGFRGGGMRGGGRGGRR